MKGRALILSLPVWAAALLITGCGGSSGECPEGQIWQGNLYGPGHCRPENGCRSWTIFIAPKYAGPDLVLDRSQSPARADLEAGSRMNVGVDFLGLDPPGCSDGVLQRGESWRTSDAGVLRVDDTGLYSATLLAVAPGTARVFADGLNQPGGRTDSVELSICADPTTTDKACERVPLLVRVVP